jgi:hypothetical protein
MRRGGFSLAWGEERQTHRGETQNKRCDDFHEELRKRRRRAMSCEDGEKSHGFYSSVITA